MKQKLSELCKAQLYSNPSPGWWLVAAKWRMHHYQWWGSHSLYHGCFCRSVCHQMEPVQQSGDAVGCGQCGPEDHRAADGSAPALTGSTAACQDVLSPLQPVSSHITKLFVSVQWSAAMSWKKYKHTAVLLMRPNATLLGAIFRFHLSSSAWWIFSLRHRHGLRRHRSTRTDELEMNFRDYLSPTNTFQLTGTVHINHHRERLRAPRTNNPAEQTPAEPLARRDGSDTNVFNCRCTTALCHCLFKLHRLNMNYS